NRKGIDGENPDSALINHPVNVVDIREQSAVDAFVAITEKAGANFERDAVDKRILQEVIDGTAKFAKNGIIDSQAEVGGWPALTKGEPIVYSDRDGMADEWEKAHNLIPRDAEDASIFTLDKNYTNVEVYLNS